MYGFKGYRCEPDISADLLITNPVSEFNEFETSLKSAKNSVSIERRLESWNTEYNFKWNQPYLSRV